MYNLYIFSIANVLDSIDEDNNILKEGLLSGILYARSSVSRLIIIEGIKETNIIKIKLRILRFKKAIKLPKRS